MADDTHLPYPTTTASTATTTTSNLKNDHPTGADSSSTSTACEGNAVNTTAIHHGVGAHPEDPRGLPVASFEEYPGLPRLNYRILDYKLKLSIIVILLVIESSLLPIILYYGISASTSLRPGLVFAIVTSFFGIVTGIEFGLRMLKLIMKRDTYRPPGGTKWSFDFTHHTLSVGYTVMSGILIGGSIPHNPPVKVLAVPVSLFLIQMGVQLTWAGWMNATRRKAPFKISSVAKGERVPPLVLTIVEDIVGVDGGAGVEYRRAVFARYAASKRFRKMIANQNWFWAVGSLVFGVGTLVTIWCVDYHIAYGIGWGTPLLFTIVWTWISVEWVRRDLRNEKRLWKEEHGQVAEMQQTRPQTQQQEKETK
ncbi:hypothetical protein B0T21DRAFT_325064 [Apiosordaria backusii]|uniref:Uncharacterized protein n=1 Tax=Apiosordaria backusii TaxID=314023 RepID=A0AA40ERY6_9PEZI|nr:hypothetical protein B0T21DRAFT_325064 [Apiosordaria backusii]